jgi:maltose/moltooligosaccharide transporter
MTDASTATAQSAARTFAKPRQSLWAICNISFGFLGIQIAFALQNANVSRIFQTLGASIDALPILWVAGPLTGLLVQPIVGYFSDRTWGRLGRRRPYFLGGAILSAIALLILPSAGVLWLAVAAFWLLDISINVAMQPFRAFVGDMLSEDQRTLGYAVQSIFIGIGALAASAMPYVFTQWLGVSGNAPAGIVPDAVRLAFHIGAAALLVAVLWTVVSTREYSPEALASFAGDGMRREPVLSRGLVREVLSALFAMPRVMRRLAAVQFFSWSGFFVLWIYTTPVVAQHHFHGAQAGTAAYNAAADWIGILFAAYNGVAALYGFVLGPLAARLGPSRLHALNLLAGSIGFLCFVMTSDPTWLLLAMVGIGIAWASVLAMPYALLCDAVPYEKFGVFMGIFNFFIVLPQLVVSGVMSYLIKGLFPGDPVGVMLIAAGSFAIAAALSWRKVGG